MQFLMRQLPQSPRRNIAMWTATHRWFIALALLATLGCVDHPQATGPVGKTATEEVGGGVTAQKLTTAGKVEIDLGETKRNLNAAGPDKKAPDTGGDSVTDGETNQEDAVGGVTERPKKKKSKTNLFKDWPQPQLVLTFSGRQHGYIEPCGCTGLAHQKGGLARRHTFLKHLRDERSWAVIPLDVGNQVRRFGRQAEMKFQLSADAFTKLGYGAVAFGQGDLQLSIGVLGAIATDSGEGSLFTAANVSILDRSFTPRHRVVEANGLKVGVVAFLGDARRKLLEAEEIVNSPAIEQVKVAMSSLTEASCDLTVLLAHATVQETRAVVDAISGFDLIVTAGGSQEPSYEPEVLEHGSLLIQVGAKGMHMPTLGYYPNEQVHWKYERVPLDDRFEDSKDMLEQLAVYQDQLKVLGLAGLDVVPIRHPTGRDFVGSSKCEECHETEYEIWLDTPHAHATDSLIHPKERSEIARHYDPECLSCHVTGWNPQKFFPYVSGYLGLKKSPQLVGNGCENCHGPGSDHVAAEEGTVDADELKIIRLRDEMKLPLANAERSCMECHDLDNSPDFHVPGAFQNYWNDIKH